MVGGLFLLLIQHHSLAARSDVAIEDADRLTSLIQIGLAYTDTPMAQRQQALAQAQVLLAQSAALLPQERAQFGLADAYLKYQQGNVDAAIKTLRTGTVAITLASHPNIYVRARSLLGGLQLTAGRRQQGLATLEDIFAQDLGNVEPQRVENARVNYASGLVQNGHVQRASEAYETALRFALSTEDDVLSLSAGSNYISLLRNQGMSGEAEYWLDRLRGAMGRTPNAMAAAALVLYDYSLILSRGDTTEAIEKLEAFLDQPAPMPSLVRAHGEELYSDALLAAGRLPEALAAGQRALKLLEQYPLEQPETLLALVRTRLAMEDFDAAGEHIAQLSRLDISRPSNVASLDQLRLEHALRVGDIASAARAFDQFIDSNQQLIDFVNQRQTDFYGEKLDRQKAESELKRAEEEKALLRAETAIQTAKANAAKMRERALRQQRGLIIGLVLVIALTAIGWIYFNARRQLQSRLRAHLREQNASLSALVESKSQDLVRTITEQSQLKQALAERRHMEAIGQIAGHVAHDFNNLLQVIASSNDLLSERAQNAIEKKALAASSQSVRSGSSTVRQLLAYSRNQQLESRVFKVSTYLRDTHALFRSAVGDVNQLSVVERCGDTLLKLDTGQLTASLINLLRNAADAMQTAGEIKLVAEVVQSGLCDPGATPEMDPSKADRFLQLRVIDQGCGMDTETLDQASRPYFTTKSDGTGLGLSSVYGFALQSGGQVEVESEVGTGTCVTLCFPVYEGTFETQPEIVVPPEPLAGSRVLIVEDNPLIAQTLMAILNREGSQPHWVSAADEAQAALAGDNTFDLLISDVKIPGSMDGFGLAQWVRERYPDVRIGMMSGYGPSTAADSAVPVLAKPFTAKELVDYLSQRRHCETTAG